MMLMLMMMVLCLMMMYGVVVAEVSDVADDNDVVADDKD